MADKRGLIVNPIKTNPGNNRRIETPNFMGNFGIERKSAEKAENFLYQWDDINIKNQILAGESYLAEQRKEALEYQNELMFNEEYYSSDVKLNELRKSMEDRKEKYEKLAKDSGFDARFTSAYLERSQVEYNNSELGFQRKFTEYSKGLQTENYALLMDTKEKNMSRIMINGDIKSGIDSYREIAIDYMTGNKNDFISMPQAIARINQAKTDLISADLYSMVNISGGKEALTAMASWGKEEFFERYKDMEFEYDGFNSMLTTEDFELFQREIGTNLNRIETKEKAQLEKTEYNRQQKLKSMRDNPVEETFKLMPYGANMNENINFFAVTASNYKYGTEFQSIQDIIDNGLTPITIGNVNSKASYYNDVNIGADVYMQERAKEVGDFVAGIPIEEQRAILDGQYGKNGGAEKILGYNGTVLYLSGNSNLRYLYDQLYTAENKQLLESVGNVEADFLSAFKMYEDSSESPFYEEIIKSKYSFNNMLPEDRVRKEGEVPGKYKKTSLGGVLFGLKLAGMTGDKHAERTAQDAEQLIKDATILMIMGENGGILTEDMAKEADLDDYKNIQISSLTPKQKQQLVSTYLEDPGRLKRLFGGENPIKKNVREKLSGALQELTAEVQTIDIGNGKFLNIAPELDGALVTKGIVNILKKSEYRNKEGQIVPYKSINPVGKVGSNEVLLFYKGEPVYDKDGKIGLIDLGGIVDD